MAMTTERYIEQAKDEARTEALLYNDRHQGETTEPEKATRIAKTKWVNNFLSQKDLPISVEQAFKSTFISEITK